MADNDWARVKAEILALVAWADGAFDDAERGLFLEVLERSSVDEETRIELVDFLEQAPEREPALVRLEALPLGEALGALRAAWILAANDGLLHPAEAELFETFARRLGLAGDRRRLLYEMLETAARADALERRLVAG